MAETTTTMDREARIAQRMARIEARRKAAELGEGRGKADGEEKREIGKGQKQILESRFRLERIMDDTNSDVTVIRVQSDDRENARRIVEEAKRQERRQKLLDEAENSAKRNAAVAMKWASLLEKDVPQDLVKEMEAQRDACNRIIASKDRMIKAFQLELKAKDDEYVKALKKQAEDIDVLFEKMGKQFIMLRKGYEDELEEVERAFTQERSELLEGSRKELEGLFEKRRQMEQRFMDAKFERIEEDAKHLDELRRQDAEEYNILKIKLESEIQMLEQQLEEMRATYQLNTEKLEYNYRVLHERDQENGQTITQQKRKLARLQDALSNAMARYAKEDRKYRQRNVEITEEYRRITDQFKDLQSKFRHFELSDNRKHRDVWRMNEGIVGDLVRKLLLADKIIHEQQLGWVWFPPSEDVFRSGQSFSETRALTVAAAGKEEAAGKPAEEPAAAGAAAGAAEGTSEAKGAAESTPGRLENVRKMLLMLCDEAGFLVEHKVQRMLEGLDPNEQSLLRVDSILKALGVESGEDVELLLTYFVGDEADGEFIHPNEAIKAIKQFVEDHQLDAKRTAKRPAAGDEKGEAAGAAAPAAGGPAGAGASGQLGASPRGRPAGEEEGEFWGRMEGVISDKTGRVWEGLQKSLEKYHGVLQERAGLIEETAGLRRQNEELKALLNQYLSSRINEELRIPPTQVIYGGKR